MIEPRRLIDAHHASELGEALRTARAQKGAEQQLARLWQKLAPLQPGAATGAAGGGKAVAALSAKGWSVLALATASALGLAAYVWNAGREQERALRAEFIATAAHEPASQRQPAAPLPAAGPEQRSQAQGAPADSPHPPGPTARPTRARVAAEPHRSAPDPRRVSRPDPQAELAVLTRAEQALAAAPQITLDLVREHAARFPDGVLAQEREILGIDAELALGRTRAAAERARAFLERFPTSPHRHRFEALLAAPSGDELDHKALEPRIPTSANPDRR